MTRAVSRIPSGLALLLAGSAALTPASRAHAWTRTEVTSMRAHADVAPSGRARVSLEIGVQVGGGWLESFELASLGSDVVLDPGKPPVAWDDAGRKHEGLGRVTEDGRVLIDFGDKKHAPRRGAYHLRVVYEAPLAQGEQPAQRMLTLPAWPLALPNAELWVHAPAGTHFAPSDKAVLEQRSVQHRGAHEVLHVLRPQLPRTHVLDAQLTLPGAASTAPTANPASTASHGVPARGMLRALAALALLLLLKLGSLRAQRSLEHAREPALRRPRTRDALRLDFDRARRERLLRIAAPGSVMDASTPLGLCVLLCAAGAAAFLAWNSGESAWLQALLIASPLWLCRAQRRAAPTSADALLMLGAILPALATQLGDTAALRLEVTSHGAAHRAASPRIALRLRQRPQGLLALRLLVAIDEHGQAGFAWHAIAEQGSPAVARILAALPHAQPTVTAPLAHAVGLLATATQTLEDARALLDALTHADATPHALEHEARAA